jgi:hypothetical protein
MEFLLASLKFQISSSTNQNNHMVDATRRTAGSTDSFSAYLHRGPLIAFDMIFFGMRLRRIFSNSTGT